MIKSKKYYLAKIKVQPNTFIGGVSATINTPALVASKLGITASRIKGFSIIGANIQFAVTGGSYNLAVGFGSNTAITYFDDADGLVTALALGCFQSCSNLRYVKIKNATTANSFALRYTALIGQDCDFSSLNYINISVFGGLIPNSQSIITLPNLTTIAGGNNFDGDTVKSNNVTFNVPLALMTINAGKPLAQLTTSSIRATIINYIGQIDDSSYNTEVGGYASVYANKGLMASFLGIGSGAFVNYNNVGLNVRFKMFTTYILPVFANNTVLTHYYDLDGLVTGLGFAGFQSCTNFKNLQAKNVTVLQQYQFRFSGFVGDNSDLSSIVTVNPEAFNTTSSFSILTLPVVTNLGGSVGNNNVFTGIKLGATITVPIALQTANAGAPDGDLVYASGTRGATIVYI